MAYLIDTDTIIFALRGDKTVLAKFEENKHVPLSISMITYAELVFGAKRSQNEQKNMIKVNHIREIYPIEELNIGVMDVFADIKVKMYAKAINNPDASVGVCCSHKVVAVGFNTLSYGAERRGIKPSARIRIEDMDLFIAATALYNDLTLVTNNTKHFENIPGLKLENWKNGKT